MRNLAGGGIRWLRRLWGPADAAEARARGREAVLPVETALAAVETLVCDGLVHRPGVAASAALARRLEESGPAPRNAFGHPVQEETGTGPRGGISVATGMALAGLRSSAFVGGEELPGALPALRDAAGRLAPLVVHAANGDAGHAGYHAVSDSGCFQLLASSGQEAIDLGLVARWVSERAMVPGLVATDGMAVERLELPGEELVQEYLGAPREPIPSPTPAQRILFGGERARLLPWFDPDRPVASGGLRSRADEARARLGRHLYFREHLAGLVSEGMEELTRLTGRPLSLVRCHQLEDAETVLVAQGSLVRAAVAVADRLRRTGSGKVGVLGVTWLRPLPSREIAGALEGRRSVAVLEVLDAPPAADPPLLREIARAAGSTQGWVSATCAGPGPDPAWIAALCDLVRRPERPRSVRLDRGVLRETTGFPRQEALLQALGNDYPELRDALLPLLPDGDWALPEPEGGRSVGLVGREAELPPDALQRLAEAVSQEAGPVVHGGATRTEPGVLEAWVCAAPEELPDPGPRAPVSMLLVPTPCHHHLGDPLARVRPGGTVLLAARESAERVWAGLPAGWRGRVRERGLRVVLVGEGFDRGIEALGACLRGEEATLEAGPMRDLAWRGFRDPRAGDRSMPQVVRRIERAREAHDSLPRFWGEVVQPREGGSIPEVPDPLAAGGAVPAGATALEPAPAGGSLPALDAEACTGCGRCWTACPDGAIGVTVMGPEALFTSASRIAGTRGAAADAMRRAHRHLAGRLASQISKSGVGQLRAEECRDAWTWLSGRLDLSDDRRPPHEAAFEATLETALGLHPVVTDCFFHAPEEQTRGSGELLLLAIDPRACLGCGLCVAECPEDALRSEPRTAGRVRDLEKRWAEWESLPDTSGGTLARAAERPDVGPLPAALLSRHCAQAQVGGGSGEPGSGERLAGRLVVALVEQHAQQRLAGLVKQIEEQRDRLDRKAREGLGRGLAEADLGTLVEALGRVGRARGALAELGRQLEELGAPASFDRPSVLRVARATRDLEEHRHRLTAGEDGLGQARFGVVVARGAVAEWAARFPGHPYHAPLTLAPNVDGVELALGIARGLVQRHLDLLRLLRRGEVEAEAPPDRAARLEEIAALGWEDLGPEERAGCSPLILLGDEVALLEQGFETLTRLLTSDLPVKVVLLDGRGRLQPLPEPCLLAIAHRRAFVLSSSLAHLDHLARGTSDALARPGPALIHLHAPSPLRHGFAMDATLERARQAVEGRVQILFRYDPAGEGLFGLRASLEGNPALDQEWGSSSFAAWAAGEERFAAHFEPAEEGAGIPLADWIALPESARRDRTPQVTVDGRCLVVGPPVARASLERLEVWNTLREVTGESSPFTGRIRDRLEQELHAGHAAEMEALRSESQARVADATAGARRDAILRLRERLMALAGYGARGGAGGNGA